MGRLEWGDSGLTIDVSVTGQALTLSLASVSVTAELNSGWGRAGWGDDGWGIQGDILLTGLSLAPSLGTPTFESKYAFTGIATTTATGSAVAGASASVDLTGRSLTTTTGTESIAIGQQVDITGQSLTTSIGKGWGAGAWGAEAWGGSASVAIGQNIDLTGESLTTAIGTETIKADADVTLTALTPLSFSIGTETIAIGQQVDITGQSIATTLGSATVTTEVNIGWGRQTWGYGQWGDAGIRSWLN